MKQDKFLFGIIVGILTLVIIALLVFFLRQDSTLVYQAEDQPKGVVFNYLLALDKGEYEKAYGYLADIPGKPSLSQFRQTMAMNKPQHITAVDVSEQTIEGKTAFVNVIMVMSGGGIFSEGYRSTEVATLEKEQEQWRILSMPYAYWSYEWNQPAFK